MARPTLFTHRKFIRLAAAVGGKAQALGSLELLWETAYASGDPFIGDAATVESIADWRGQPGALATALHAGGNGFLDLHEDGYHVHDLEDHAPEYVHKRWERERRRREAGQTIRSQRQAAARESWKARAANDRATDHANGGRLQDVCNASVSPPAPAPAPKYSPPAPARDPGGTEPWHAHRWLQKFGQAWCEKYQRQSYGQGTADAIATAELGDALATLTSEERLAAEELAPLMFAEYLGSTAPGRVSARHPFKWFVADFNGLRVPAVPISRAAARGSPRDRGDPRVGHRRAEDFKHTTGEVKFDDERTS